MLGLACARRTLSNGIDAIIAKAEPVQPTDPSVKTFETLESLEVMSPRYLLVDAAHPDICRPVLNPKNFAFGTNNAREHEQDRRELVGGRGQGKFGGGPFDPSS